MHYLFCHIQFPGLFHFQFWSTWFLPNLYKFRIILDISHMWSRHWCVLSISCTLSFEHFFCTWSNLYTPFEEAAWGCFESCVHVCDTFIYIQDFDLLSGGLGILTYFYCSRKLYQGKGNCMLWYPIVFIYKNIYRTMIILLPYFGIRNQISLKTDNPSSLYIYFYKQFLYLIVAFLNR